MNILPSPQASRILGAALSFLFLQACSSTREAPLKVTSQTTMGNHKITKGTSTIDLNGEEFDDELTFEEDDFLADSSESDDATITITSKKSNDTVNVGIDDDMGVYTFKHGSDTVKVAIKPDGTVQFNGQTVLPAEFEAKTKAEPAFKNAPPSVHVLLTERLGSDGYVDTKQFHSHDVECVADSTTFFSAMHYLFWDWTMPADYKRQWWSVTCRCLKVDFSARCTNGAPNF